MSYSDSIGNDISTVLRYYWYCVVFRDYYPTFIGEGIIPVMMLYSIIHYSGRWYCVIAVYDPIDQYDVSFGLLLPDDDSSPIIQLLTIR